MYSVIPETFRATISDRFLAAFFSGKSDTMIQVELSFSISLDAEILKKAFDMVLDAEPILGCSFVLTQSGAEWVRLDPQKRGNMKVLSDSKAYDAYRSETINPHVGPALQGALLQTDSGDKLLFKIAHEAADASGAKDAVAMVAYLYRKLLRNPDFMQVPNARSYRSARQLFKWFPKRTIPVIWWNALCEMVPLFTRRKALNPFVNESSLAGREYTSKTIAAQKVTQIKRYGRQHGATVNDLLLAAFLRSVYINRANSGGVLRCGMTVDLRRWYFPGGKAEAIANLSNIEVFDIGTTPGVQFDETLKRVVAFTARRKRNWIGLNLHCGLINLFRTWSFEKMKNVFGKQQIRDCNDSAVFPIFTNLGILDKEDITFGSVPQTASVIVPAGYPPYFGVGVSGYDGSLTLTAASYVDTREQVGKLLDDMINEIEAGCTG